HFPMPSRGTEATSAEVQLDGAPLGVLNFPNADEYRARMLMGAPISFSSYVFNGEVFPQCDFENPLLAERLLGPYRIKTTFYDKDYNEVGYAGEAGRYGAVIEAVPESGAPVKRMQTIYRAPFALGGVKEWFMRP